MGLSARELVLILRARDEASRAIHQVGGSIQGLGSQARTTEEKLQGIGTAMLTVGTAMAGTGGLATSFFNSATNDAQDYGKQVALTLTQAHETGATFEELSDIGKRIGGEIPAAFGNIQGSLFDIFSTVETTVPEAEATLRQLAKAAVAGDADISSVSRTTLAALNAWQKPLSETEDLLDIQFRLVEKGVGTYDEFSGAIGRAIPAAVAADQSLESLAGMMSFLTRNGLSTEMAATSAARALELMAKPDVTKKLEAMGVTVRDNEGNFRQMNEIVTDLADNQGWARLAAPERKELFQDIFGTGTIQARRFFDLAIPNFQDMNKRFGEIQNSAGAMDRAYEIMLEQPAAQAALLTNQYEIMKTTVGEQLLPAKVKLMEVAMQLLDAWNSLDKDTQNLIVKIAAAASAFLLIAGTITAVVGGVLLFVGIVAPVVGGVAALIKIFLALNVALLAIAAVAFLVWQNWDQVKAVLIPIWEALSQAVTDFVNTVKSVDWVGLWNSLIEGAQKAWNWLSSTFGPGLKKIADAILDAWNTVIPEVIQLIQNFQQKFQEARPIIEAAMNAIVAVIKAGVNFILTLWRTFGPSIIAIVSATWNFLTTFIASAIRIIANVIALVLNIIQGDWSGAWNNIKAILKAVWEVIKATVRLGWEVLKALFRAGNAVISATIRAMAAVLLAIVRSMMNSFLSAVRSGWNLVRGVFARIPATIRGIFSGAGRWLFNAGRAILNGLKDGISNAIGGVKSKLREVTNLIPSWKGPEAKDRKLLMDNGMMIMQGLQGGLEDGWRSVQQFLTGITHSDKLMPDISLGAGSMNVNGSQLDFNTMVAAFRRALEEAEVERAGLKVEGDVVLGDSTTVDDLDFWAAKQNAGV